MSSRVVSLTCLQVNGNSPCSFLFLQPTVEPLEECALPQHAVLWFKYPVVLVGEDKQLGWDAFHTCSVKCTHALGGVDAIIFLAMNAEYGRIPFVDKAMGRVFVCAFGVGRLVFVPVRIIVFPI